MVEVFKTTITCAEQAAILAEKLLSQFPRIKIHFDLEDCDKVLRVEGIDVASNKIIEMLNCNGYQCQVLE